MKPAQRTRQLSKHLQHKMASPQKHAAPWRKTFLEHLEQMDEKSFVLSTLRPNENASSSTTEPQYVPRARYVIYRGMWADIPVNPKNPAELNPDIYETDLPTITSDARMEKIPELFKTATDSDESPSGKGGPIEAVFWIPKVQSQWRMRGHSYIVGPDIDSKAAAPVREALDAHMRLKGRSQSWSWSKELTAQFGNMSPGMRGSFRNPPPGTPMSEKPSEGLGIGQKVEDVHDEIARKNFRVIVIVPEEVERVDLSESKRWNYKHIGSEDVGTWKVTEMWP